MAPVFVCFNCSASKPTLQGLRSHISQRQACREAFAARFQLQATTPASPSSAPIDLAAEHQNLPDNSYDTPLVSPQIPDAQDSPEPPSKRARVEEVEDIEPGGLPKRPFRRFDTTAGQTYGEGRTLYERMQEEREREGLGENPWEPFENQQEWELARWLLSSGLSQSDIDKYLKLEIVRLFVLFKPSTY